MSKWFPDVGSPAGVKSALNGGFYACLAFAGMNLLGLALLLFAGRMPSSGKVVSEVASAGIGIFIEMSFILFAAWRFRKAKGLIAGSAVGLLFAFEIFAKVVSGTARGGWFVVYVAVLIGLINGLRGAWATRSIVDDAEVVETFS
ncbi:hypothetical protein WG901_08050 [Novosphingobium sp. PS1R-30]|uniref:Uncharacterized protein n=1 Tax=Novosphingobium anseongense TaxID=3133436 RepID=A0ABU8RUZ3_9SPHN